MIKIFLVIALFFFISICSKPSLSDEIAELDEVYQKLSGILREEPKIFSFEGKPYKIDVQAMSRFITYVMLIFNLDLFYKTKYHLKFARYFKDQINLADFKLVKDFTGNLDDIPIYFPPALSSLLTANEQIDFSKLNFLPILDENNNLVFSPEDQYFLLKHVFDVESSLDQSERDLRRKFCSLSDFESEMFEEYRLKTNGVDKFKTILGFMKQLHAKNSNESCFSLKLSLNLKGCETEYVIKFDDFLNNNDLESEEQVNEKAKYLLAELEKDLKWTNRLDAMFSEEFKAEETEEGKPIEHQNYSYDGGGGGGNEVGEINVSEEDNTSSDSLGDHFVEHSTEAPSTPDNNISTDPIKPSDQDELKAKKEEEGKPIKNQNYGGGGPEVGEIIVSEDDNTPSDSLENDNTSSLAENSTESIPISTDLIKPTNQDDSKASTTNDPNSSKKSPEVELSTKSSIQPKDPVKTGSSVHGEIVNEKTNFIKSSAEAKDDDYMFEYILICFSVLAVLFVVGVVFYNKRSKAPTIDL
jgi:hypothetical protein